MKRVAKIVPILFLLNSFCLSENGCLIWKKKRHIKANLVCQSPPINSGKEIVPYPVYKKHFGINEDIWVAVSPRIGRKYYKGKDARICIVHNKTKDQWNNRTIIEDVSGVCENITIKPNCASNNYSKVWSKPGKKSGCYDVIIDFPRYGRYDKGRDIIDGLDEGGFFVSELWVDLKSVTFNHNPTCDKCDAINIRKNYFEEVHIPEWDNGRSYPAVYIRDRYITIKAIFSAEEGVETAMVGARAIKGDFGNLEEKRVYFKENGISCPVYFDISKKTPIEIKTFDQEWEWYYQDINGNDSGEKTIRHSKNKIYIILSTPQEPWSTQGQSEPWTDVLDISCSCANGETTQEGAAERITKYLYKKIGGKYDIWGGDPQYTSFGSINLDLVRFMKVHPYIRKVNCSDMAKALVTFSNVIGCCLCYKEVYVADSDEFFTFRIKCIKPIGRLKYCHLSFLYHAFSSFFDKVFDASLKVYISRSENLWMINKSWECYKKKLIKDSNEIDSPVRGPVGIGKLEKSVINESVEKRIDSAKCNYNYKFWDKGTGEFIPGINIDSEMLEDILPSFKMKKVWEEDIYSIEKVEQHLFSVIRKCWESRNSRLYITMVLGPNMEAVKKYLLFNYADMSNPLDKITEVAIGNIYFSNGPIQNKKLLEIDFIRNNVLIKLEAEGRIEKELQTIAGKLDGLLMNNVKKINETSRKGEKKIIINFYSEKESIKVGEEVRLHVTVSPEERERFYYWELTGGGIEKDCNDNFVYYGSDSGIHTITLYIITDEGIHDFDSLEIEVINNRCG